MPQSDKTEQATPRRRQKAREKGQIARSRDLMSGLAVAAVIVLLGAQASAFVIAWRAMLRHTLEAAAGGEPANPVHCVAWAGMGGLGIVSLLIALGWLAAMAGAVAQGGLVFAPSSLAFNPSRFNPASRLEQLFSLPSVGRLLKSLLPGGAIVYLAATILLRDWDSLLDVSRFSVAYLVRFAFGHAFEIAWKSALVLLLWAAVDYAIERHKLSSELRMSRQDLKDEFKETEGHPTVKARIRRLRRQISRRHMLDSVKRASVVITNPNEFAVALEYGSLLPAPVVVAKGRNLLARQIKEAARWHGIPLVENPPLAHALYRAVEVGQSIPPKLYAVVAAILAAIYRAQERAAGKR